MRAPISRWPGDAGHGHVAADADYPCHRYVETIALAFLRAMLFGFPDRRSRDARYEPLRGGRDRIFSAGIVGAGRAARQVVAELEARANDMFKLQ